MNLSWRRWWPAPLLGVTLLAYANSFGGVLTLDDAGFIDNPGLRHLGDFRWLYFGPRMIPNFSVVIDNTLWGETTTGLHLTNLLIHVANSVLLYLLCETTWRLVDPKLSDDDRALRSLAIALVWAVHPIEAQAVTYVAQRIESLSATGMLLCLWAYARGQPSVGRAAWAWFAVAWAGAMFAYASKEHSVMLFALVWLYQRAYLSPTTGDAFRRSGWFLAALVLPLCIVAPRVLSGLAAGTDQTVGLSLRSITPWDYALSQPAAILRYLRLIMWPDALCMDYGWDKVRPPECYFYLAALLLIFAGIGALWRRSPAAAFPLTACFVILLPTSSFIVFQDLIFEHRVYLASAGVIAFLVPAAFRYLPPRYVAAAFIPLVILLTARTALRNFDYYSRELLIQQDLQVSPDNPRLYARLAEEVPADARGPREFQLFARAVELSKARGWFFAGTDYKWRREAADILFHNGQTAEALVRYLECEPLAYDDTQAGEVCLSIALCHSIRGENDAAEKYFARAAEKWKNPLVQRMRDAHRERVKAKE